MLTIAPGAVAGNGITPVNRGGAYGKTLVNPDYTDFSPRVGFAYAVTPKTAIRGGFGTGYVHYTRAGSGDITGINAPQAQFAAVVQPTPSATNHCNPVPAQIIKVGSTTPSCYVTSDQGFPTGLVTTFNPATDNITWVPKDRPDSYVENYFLSVQRQLTKNTLMDVAYVGNHGLILRVLSTPTSEFSDPRRRQRSRDSIPTGPAISPKALNEFYSNYNALQVRYEQRSVAGLTLLDSFTWEHSLDNASASLEGNTPSPQNGLNLAADYANRITICRWPTLPAWFTSFLSGTGGGSSNANGVLDSVIGGWQISAINTAQAGTPFNLTYSPTATSRSLRRSRPPIVAPTNTVRMSCRERRLPGNFFAQANTGYVNYINYAAFVIPPAQDASKNYLSPFGNASRNPGRTPPFNETDLDLNKTFRTPIETLKIEFRAEAYNVFNHTNFYLPGNISGSQGTITANTTLGTGATPPLSAITGGVPSGGGQITSTFEPRILQFALKVMF